MFNFFKKSSPIISGHESLTLKLSGLHCSSCAVNIDLALEDLPSVKATTNYAKSETKITYDPKKTKQHEIHAIILDLGYQII